MVRIELEDSSIMHSSRKGAFLLLVVAVFWSALPAAACLLKGHSMNRPACCKAMAPDCPMEGSSMNSSCCTAQPNQAIVVPDIPVLPKQDHALTFPLHATEAVAPVLMAATGWRASESSPPEISPGAKLILRI
jgi:hypothetical protein